MGYIYGSLGEALKQLEGGSKVGINDGYGFGQPQSSGSNSHENDPMGYWYDRSSGSGGGSGKGKQSKKTKWWEIVFGIVFYGFIFIVVFCFVRWMIH